MQRKSFWNWLSIFETGLSAAEWAWRIVTLLIILGGGTAAGLIAKAQPLSKAIGPIYWVGVGIIAALIFSIILYLVKSSRLKEAQANLNRMLAVPGNTINPLSHSFTDSIIPMEDLRLPYVQLHEYKHFTRCKFVGPAAVTISGGTYVRCGFYMCGDVIAIPDGVQIAGIVGLKNCTVEDCEFIKITILADHITAKSFAAVPGVRVIGALT
jgi:hypothetical protein